MQPKYHCQVANSHAAAEWATSAAANSLTFYLCCLLEEALTRDEERGKTETFLLIICLSSSLCLLIADQGAVCCMLVGVPLLQGLPQHLPLLVLPGQLWHTPWPPACCGLHNRWRSGQPHHSSGRRCHLEPWGTAPWRICASLTSPARRSEFNKQQASTARKPGSQSTCSAGDVMMGGVAVTHRQTNG